MNLDSEVILIGHWYQLGTSEYDDFKMLYEEITMFSTKFTGMIWISDFHVHHVKWFRFSNGNSIVGADLKIISEDYELYQVVKVNS